MFLIFGCQLDKLTTENKKHRLSDNFCLRRDRSHLEVAFISFPKVTTTLKVSATIKLAKIVKEPFIS